MTDMTILEKFNHLERVISRLNDLTNEMSDGERDYFESIFVSVASDLPGYISRLSKGSFLRVKIGDLLSHQSILQNSFARFRECDGAMIKSIDFAALSRPRNICISSEITN